MGYPSKIQCIKRKTGWRQFYLNLPAALAEALNCEEGETWSFTIVDRKTILLERSTDPRVPPLKRGK
jgi:hypothetical protein